jgi:hypothetical protein
MTKIIPMTEFILYKILIIAGNTKRIIQHTFRMFILDRIANNAETTIKSIINNFKKENRISL